MPYRFATQDLDYSDYAAGRVLYSQPDMPAFPVRLASEIFQRAHQILQRQQPLMVYDPTCGGAYHLCAIGFLHNRWIDTIAASDADEEVLALARRNLSLLSPTGLQRRVKEIEDLLARYGKTSHLEALSSAHALKTQLSDTSRPVQIHTFQANAMERGELQKGLAGKRIDLVISDVPYGQLSSWHLPEANTTNRNDPLWRMLDALLWVLSPTSLVAIAADKRQKITHAGYRRVQRFILGKRQVAFLTPA